MSPHLAAPPPTEEEKLEKASEKTRQRRADLSSDQRFMTAPAATSSTDPNLFAGSLLELSTSRPRRRTVDLFLSLALHVLMISTLILVPLFFTEAIDLKQFTQTMLVAPPPPPPPPPPAAPVIEIRRAPQRVFSAGGRLLAPTVIPERIAMLKEEPLPPDMGPSVGVVGGVPGGVPGGQIGGVIGGIISGANKTYIPQAPVVQPKAPVRVGGRVKAPSLLRSMDPVYPALARQARLSGDVVIDAVIDTAGNVVEMKVVSGHPLLIPAAMQALKQWKYAPTLLNDEPVSVQLLVTIKFRLN